ncbi:MAG: hypothetical protein CMJ78_25025 [Planctomycetaceae bacterium]|nr:hypothetical protein [Planctomycetaceae bacterium]
MEESRPSTGRHELAGFIAWIAKESSQRPLKNAWKTVKELESRFPFNHSSACEHGSSIWRDVFNHKIFPDEVVVRSSPQ